MRLLAEIRKMVLGSLSLLALSAGVLTACDDAIYDDEGNCTPVYKVNFRYDYNMKFADAFASEVKTVSLYAFDASGKFVKSFNGSVAAMAANGYQMDVDLAPGQYKLVAWGGLNDGMNSYNVPTLSPGDPITALTNTLKRDENAVVKEIDQLYHGMADVTFPDQEGVHSVTVPLVKDSNRIKIILQSLSGTILNVEDFKFYITSEDGKMNYDNSLMPDEVLTYQPYFMQSGSAEVITRAEEEGETQQLGLVMAELNTARLVKDWQTRTWLHITNAEGKNIITVPLIDMFLLIKGKYGQNMSDQEFLDRQDDYNMTFFLYDSYSGEGEPEHEWMSSEIIINKWKVVLQDADL